ncbi:hypothetical protein D3Z38_19625, partial [Clostridiales bacterium]|nr:hypothetical protein [Clostridiales bacterium]
MVVSFQSSVDRNAASRDTHITWPWRSLDGGARQFPISRQKRRRPRRQHPPGPRGAGAEGRPRAPDRQSLGTYVNRNPTVRAGDLNGRTNYDSDCNGQLSGRGRRSRRGGRLSGRGRLNKRGEPAARRSEEAQARWAEPSAAQRRGGAGGADGAQRRA